MAKLESLIVDLQVNNAQLKKGLDDATKKVDDFGKQLKKIGQVVTLNALASVTKQLVSGLASFVMKGAQAADQAGKMAQAAGSTVEEFTRLEYGARLSGISSEELSGALGRLNKSLSEAANGGKEQAALFRALGISVKDASGHVRSGTAVMGDLAAKFASLEGGASKNRLALDLFGRQLGGKMIPLMNQGREGLAELAAEADRFGVTISSNTAAAAESFNDNLERMHIAAERVAVRVAGELSPSLANLTDFLLQSKAGADALKGSAEVLANVIRVLASAGVIVGAVFNAVGKGIAAAASMILAAAVGNFAGEGQVLEDFGKQMAADARTTVNLLKGIWDENDKAVEKSAKSVKRSADEIVKGIDAVKKAAAQSKMEFDVALKASGTQRQADNRAASFANIGQTPEAVLGKATAGFKDFEDALFKATEATVERDMHLAEAALARQFGDEAAAQESLLFADQMDAAAEVANKAVDGFEQLAQRTADAAQDSINRLAQGIGAAANHLLSKLGDLGTVVSSAIQGFQQGGWWGAIIAVIVEVFSRFARFAEVQQNATDQLNAFVDQLGPALNRLTDGFEKLQNSLGKMKETVGTALTPVLDEVGRILGVVGDVLGPVFEAVQAIIEPVTNILSAFTGIASALDPLQPVLKLVGALFKVIGVAFLGLGFILQRGAAALLGVFAEAAAKLGLGDLSKKLADMSLQLNLKANEAKQKMHEQWGELDREVKGYGGPGSDDKKNTNINTIDPGVTAGATANVEDLGNAAEKTANSMAKLTEQFTNVPAGFMVRLRQAQAMDPIERLSAVGGLATLGGGNVTVNVHGSVLTESRLADVIARALNLKRFRRSGL